MNKGIKILFGIFFIISAFTVPSFSIAETQIQVQDSDLNIEISPSNPKPYEDVTVTLSSYATDLNKAVISWQNDTKTVLSGIGKTIYSFKALGPNTTTTINVSIRPVDSMSSITKNIIITPSEVGLYWESVDGYTPLFYKGKSLPTKSSMIKVLAIPDTKTIKSGSGSVSYTWKVDDSVVEDASGYNKNSYVFRDDMFKNTNSISVIASSVNDNYSASNNVEIPIYSSKVIFYKKSPAEGILYNNALGSNSPFHEEEMTVVAEPYFLPIKGHEDIFIYKWKINNETINTPTKKTELTVRPSSRGGYANISVTFENPNKLFQIVSGMLKLNL